MYDNVSLATGVPQSLISILDKVLNLSDQKVSSEQAEYVYHKYNQLSHPALWLVAEKLSPLEGTNPFQHAKETRYFLNKIIESYRVDKVMRWYTDEYLNSTFQINRLYIDGVRIPVHMCAFRKGEIRIEPKTDITVNAPPWFTPEEGIYKTYIGTKPYRFRHAHIKGGDLLLVT